MKWWAEKFKIKINKHSSDIKESLKCYKVIVQSYCVCRGMKNWKMKVFSAFYFLDFSTYEFDEFHMNNCLILFTRVQVEIFKITWKIIFSQNCSFCLLNLKFYLKNFPLNHKTCVYIQNSHKSIMRNFYNILHMVLQVLINIMSVLRRKFVV